MKRVVKKKNNKKDNTDLQLQSLPGEPGASWWPTQRYPALTQQSSSVAVSFAAAAVAAAAVADTAVSDGAFVSLGVVCGVLVF